MKKNTPYFFFLAARPKTLFASLCPVLFGSLYFSWSFQFLSYQILVITLACAALLQISSNLTNDLMDGLKGSDTKERLGPKRMLAAGLVTKKAMILGILAVNIISLILGFYLISVGGLPIAISGFLSILFAFLYSGGPLPLSRFYMGEVLAFAFFGPLACWGSFYLQWSASNSAAAFFIPTPLIFFGLYFGLLSAHLMAINNLRDRKEDAAAKKLTIASVISERHARYFTVALFLLATVLAFFAIAAAGEGLIAFISLFFLFLSHAFSEIELLKIPLGKNLNLHLERGSKLILVSSILLGVLLSF